MARQIFAVAGLFIPAYPAVTITGSVRNFGFGQNYTNSICA